MKFFAINGSPRPKCNTARLLDESLEGVKRVLSFDYEQKNNVFSYTLKEKTDYGEIILNG